MASIAKAFNAIRPASIATISRDPGRGPDTGKLLLVKGIGRLLADFLFGRNYGLRRASAATKDQSDIACAEGTLDLCGIAGLWTKGSPDLALLTRMATAIVHRGPDDAGIWIDSEAGLGLAHRRLSIVDLSPHGHQPMLSSDGRFALSFNGEIYNHRALRVMLDDEGRTPEGGWRGHSDTETLVEAIAAWGLDSVLDRLVGMFAFALWDRRERALHLVRDRFGEKPLYYGWAGRDFVFASELKAIRVHPDFDPQIDRRALHAFAAHTNVPAPLSIYRRIFKLEPGCVLTLANLDPFDAPPAGQIRHYYDYASVVRAGLADPIIDEVEARAALEAALNAAIDGQAVADVPVGAFLSGGIDSSTVTAFYQQRSNMPVRTYTIGFEEAAYNEQGSRSQFRHVPDLNPKGRGLRPAV